MRLHKYIIIVSILFLCSEYVTGQQQLDWRLMTMDDGLANRDIQYVCRDPRGFMWIVSSDIQFYDGQRMVTYNQFDANHRIPVSGISSAYQLYDSLLLFSTGSGIYALNLLNGRTRMFPLPEGVPADAKNLNFLPTKGRQKYIPLVSGAAGSLQMYVVNSEWELLYTVTGDQLYGTRMGRNCSFDIGSDGAFWVIHDNDGTLTRTLRDDTQVIRSNDVKFNSDTHGLLYWDGYGLIICSHDGEVSGVPDGSLQVKHLRTIETHGRCNQMMYRDDHGIAWMICRDQIIRFDPLGTKSDVFNVKAFGEFTPTTRAVYIDHEGSSWISTEIGLLVIRDRVKHFEAFLKQPPNGRNMQFREILQGTDNQIFTRAYQYERDLIEIRYDPASGLIDTTVHLTGTFQDGVFRTQGDHIYYIRASASPHFIEYDPLRFVHPDFHARQIQLPDRPLSGYYPAVTFDDSGILLYPNSEFNVTEFNIATGESSQIPTSGSQGLRNGFRSLLTYSSDRILIGTPSLGVYVCDRTTGEILTHYHAESDPPMSSNRVNEMYLDGDGVLWVGTIGGGVNRIDIENDYVKYYTTRDGLANNVIASFVDDLAGGLWIGTYHGLSMLDKATETFYNYFVEDGLPDNEFNYLSALRVDNGRIYMGTLNGIVTFMPGEVSQSAELPAVKLTSILKYNRRTDTLSVQEHNLDSIEIVEVSPYDNYVQFDFAVPSFVSNGTHTFRAKLEGIDQDWQELGRSHFIRYQKLPAGKYNLLLAASDGRGNTTEMPTLVKLHVQQFFYKSVWFIAFCLGVLIAAIYALYRYRLRFLQREQETRVRIASDLHDEVGSSLTGLSLKLQMMELQAPEGQKKRLTEVSDVIQKSIYKMRDLVWSVDARSDRWSSILERMQDYASDLLFPLEIALDFSTKGIDEQAYLDAHTKHNLYLIFKEAVHNISKHSDATKVIVSLILDHGLLKMEVRDNGTGSSDSLNNGQGLQNMHMRAERLKGTLITESSGEGFVVCLEFRV